MTQTTEANQRMNRSLDSVDPQIADLLRDEARRQATGLELIPSENLVSEAVLEAMLVVLLRVDPQHDTGSHGHFARPGPGKHGSPALRTQSLARL